MISALKRVVIPVMRGLGFSGSFPHLRRRGSTKIDLLTFQFDRNGGGFIIEIAQCSLEGVTTHWGKHITPNKVSAWDVHPNQRLRLQPHSGSGTDSWFRFDFVDARAIAQSVLPFLEQANVWYAAGAPIDGSGVR